jgi:hypothetical protein
MDYSKQGGGTRIHDQLKARTLATGHGSTVTAARATGSHRAQRVAEGIKPGQHVSDPGLRQVHGKRMDEMMAAATMDPPPQGPESVKHAWPLSSGSKSHEDLATTEQHATSDQGEEKRVPSTGQHSRIIQQGMLAGAGK